MGDDLVDEDVIVEMDGTTEDDEPTWASGQGLDGLGTDIELDSKASYDYDGDESLFWEHVATWGRGVLETIEPSHGILVTASNMKTTRHPCRVPDGDSLVGETEFERIAHSLSGVTGFSFMTVNCFPKDTAEALPMDIVIAFPTVVIETYDIPVRDRLLETFAMPTERLRKASTEEHGAQQAVASGSDA